MVEYRHNKDWGTLTFTSNYLTDIKQNIVMEAERDRLGDIEVIDVQITKRSDLFFILVFYANIVPKKPSKITVK